MASQYRRRRIVWGLVIVSAITLFYVSTHTPSSFWSIPASLKDLGFSSSSSPAKQVGLAKLKDAITTQPEVPEIQALLHFLTAYPERRLNEQEGAISVKGLGPVQVDALQAIDLRVYAPDGNTNWQRHLRALKDDYPLVVFSKTYCPYSQGAKALLLSYDIDPPPHIVELNLRSDGPIIQTILARLTGRRTVPNILLRGNSLGGGDDLESLHQQQKLKGMLREGGLTVDGVLVT
ncbi:thioredoxin-like protein [Amylocystis lapponica]|nr:thioredoxin-like protein [Amylocystis lapponica]